MRSALLFLASAIALVDVNAQSNTFPVTGLLGNATVVTNNPVGPVYQAILPTTEFWNPQDPHGNIKGSVIATAAPNGIGVQFTVNFQNLPATGGPFLYHIHAYPVNSTGSCAAALAHLDPFIRGETPACDPTLPQTCQVGDLAGKYGKITSDPFTATYTDLYASTVQGLGSFFGNRSIVVHFANTTRITCANFALISDATTTTVISNTTTAMPTLPMFTGSASSLGASVLAVVAAAVVVASFM